MPVHNSKPEQFRTALDSLLAQDEGNFEIILSDNASNPEIEAVHREAATRDPRIRYVRQPQLLSAGDNFRFTLSQARGEFFFWAADDDVRAPSFARRTVAALRQQPAAMLAGCEVAYIDEAGVEVGQIVFHPDMDSPSAIRRMTALGQPGFYMDIYGLYRRAALCELEQHLVRNGWGWGTDTVIVLEMLLRGPILRVPERLFFYRLRAADQGASLAGFLIEKGAADKDPRRDWESDRARQILAAVSRSKLPPTEKLLALALTSVIVRRRPFIDERLRLEQHRYTRALQDRSYLEAFRAAAAYIALSPLAPLRRSAWKRALNLRRLRF